MVESLFSEVVKNYVDYDTDKAKNELFLLKEWFRMTQHSNPCLVKD